MHELKIERKQSLVLMYKMCDVDMHNSKNDTICFIECDWFGNQLQIQTLVLNFNWFSWQSTG